MIKRLLFFVRTRELTEDIIIGTTWGAVWGLLLAWGWNHLPSKVGITPEASGYLMRDLTCSIIGAFLGFLLALRASVIYGGRSGIFDERKIYGETALQISLAVSIIIGVWAGSLAGATGVIVGGVIGAVVGGIGFFLSFICISVVALAIGAILHIPFTVLGYFWKLSALTSAQRKALNYYEIGGKFDRSNRIQDAILSYQKAVQLEPGFPEAHLNLGIDYGLTGQSLKEVAHYEEALNLRPDYAKAVRNLSISYVEQGDESKARNLVTSKESLLSTRQMNEVMKDLELFIRENNLTSSECTNAKEAAQHL